MQALQRYLIDCSATLPFTCGSISKLKVDVRTVAEDIAAARTQLSHGRRLGRPRRRAVCVQEAVHGAVAAATTGRSPIPVDAAVAVDVRRHGGGIVRRIGSLGVSPCGEYMT